MSVLDFLKSLQKLVEAEANSTPGSRPAPQPAPQYTPQQSAPAPQQQPPEQWDGTPYSEYMPPVPNQFNYGGPYWEYFEEIFRTELPALSFTKETAPYGKRLIYTFSGPAGRALVVELMSESCDSRKIRNDCQASGTPYLRFYYDHERWWNTRTYVAERLHKAVGI